MKHVSCVIKDVPSYQQHAITVRKLLLLLHPWWNVMKWFWLSSLCSYQHHAITVRKLLLLLQPWWNVMKWFWLSSLCSYQHHAITVRKLLLLLHPWWNVMKWFWLSSCLCLRMCEMNVAVLIPVTYASVIVVTNWLLLCTSDSILHYHIVFTQYLGIRHEANHSIMHLIQQQQKYSVFTGVAILIIYVPRR